MAKGNSVDRFTIVDMADGKKKPVQWIKINDRTVKAVLPSPFGPFYMNLSHAYMYPGISWRGRSIRRGPTQ